ncbi:MAG: S8 family serine peptidase, partial [Bacteroidales bacterium]|nr:S8 family serine peptidase [Bacteroidales bacterium]
MKKSLIFLAFCLLALGAFAQVNIQTDPITSDLHQEIHKSASAGLLRINIRLKDQFDSQEFMRKKSSLTREDRRNILVAELKFFASRTQQNLIESLLTYSQTGEVADIKPLWIANVITCYATPERIYQLATRPDIERIDIDEERVLIESAVFQNLSESYGESGMEIPYNVANVNAPGVWAQGFTGSGVVVALLDSGVNYNHTDLTGNLWTHPDFPYHGWNFVGNNNNPLDDNGHGTHTAGTVAGQGASGTQTGVAPNAQIMALKVMSSDGSATESGVWNAIQFAVEQGADIISMSLGWLHAWNPDRATWRNTMVNVLYSGIIASVAAGNEGDQQASYPIPDNVRTPGDCPAPWLHPDQTLTGRTSAVVCVGAVTSSDTPTGFSGRGPVTWLSVAGYRDYAYNPGIGLIRPDVVAPGVAVKSLSHDSNTGYTTMSGTSMATPCVAGVMALMLSKNSNTEPVLISQILEETAFPLSTVKNNVVGSGRVDALGAVNATGSPGPIYQSHTFHDSAGNGDGNVNPGENILLSLGIINKANQSFSNVNVTIRTNSAFVTITDSIELYGSFNPGELIVKESAFRIVVADNIPNGHAIKFFISASTGPETWRSHFTAYAYTPLLSSGNLIVIDPTGNANNILDPSESTIIQFPVLNKGMMEAVDVQVSLTTSSSFINISNIFSNAGNIAPESLVRANFGVGVSHVAPFGSNVVFTLTVASGVYLYQKDYTLKIGNIIEDFESADFSNFDWIFSGHQPWMISSQDSWEGLYAARSGATGNSQSSQLSLSINVAKADYISFKYLVSSELNCDYLKFYIDNDFMGQWSGEVSWQGVLYPVMPGLRSFRWEYVKNIDLAGGRDGAWVDYVSLPLPLITAVYAGPDASICAGLPHQLQGVAMNGTGLQWTTSGNGTFSNNAIPNPMYTPSAEDIEAEKVILILSAISAGNELIHDILILHIQQQSIAWAGDDTTICLTNTFYTQDAVAAH